MRWHGAALSVTYMAPFVLCQDVLALYQAVLALYQGVPLGTPQIYFSKRLQALRLLAQNTGSL